MNIRIPKDLQRLSNRELLILEDKILLDNELQAEDRSFFIQNRFVIYCLAILLFFVSQIILSSVFMTLGLQNNPLAIFLYVGCLIVSVFAAFRIWEQLGLHLRYWIRTALHYWPLTLTLVIYASYLPRH